MKKLIKIIIISLLFINCKAQTIVNGNTFNQGSNDGKYFKDMDNYLLPFVGTWQNTTGNITFRIILWKETMQPFGNPVEFYQDNIGGSFMIIQDAGTANEVILHNSVKYYPTSDYTTDNVFRGTAGVNSLGGYIYDNYASGGTETLVAFYQLTKITPTTARWKIKDKGIGVQGHYYSVPMDAIMTKIN